MGFKQICGLYGFAEDIFDFLPRFFLAMQQQSSACFFMQKFYLKRQKKRRNTVEIYCVQSNNLL
jgi:hypothetical protein